MALYYHKITGQIVSWDTLKGMFGTVFSGVSEGVPGMHSRLYDQNPPNTRLDTYPDLANWFVLEQPATPSHALYEIVEEGTPSFIAATGPAPDKGKYTKTHNIRLRTRTPLDEMIGINQQISGRAKQLRDEKLNDPEVVLEHNGFYFTPDNQTLGVLGELIEFLETHAAENPNATIPWKGPEDSEGLPRRGNAKIEDLQGMVYIAEQYRQKAQAAEMAVTEEQRENLAIDIETTFESLDDVNDFFNDVYDNL